MNLVESKETSPVSEVVTNYRSFLNTFLNVFPQGQGVARTHIGVQNSVIPFLSVMLT